MERDADNLTLTADGAQRWRAGITRAGVAALKALANQFPADRAGTRLYGVSVLKELLDHGGEIGSLAAGIQGCGSRPVRAILFDKTADMNWGLGWHQDRTVCVKERIDVPGFGPWTVKDGALHVAPPFEILARMITLRVHLDDVGLENAPLLVAPGSHLLGRVPENLTASVVQRCGTVACLAHTGDAWMYATPILHASRAAEAPSRRRVLQVDYAACDLPGGLDWLGVA